MANVVPVTPPDSGILARFPRNPAAFHFHPPPAHQRHKSPALRSRRHATLASLPAAPAAAPAAAMVSAEAGIDRVLWTEAEVSARVGKVAADLAADLRALPPGPPAVVVGVATGALLFLADLVRRVDVPLAVDFVRVESYGGGTESSGRPRITADLKVDVAGKHVVVVEDIVDTGNTLSYLIAHLEKKGASSISVCTFLDKPARRKVNIQLVGEESFTVALSARTTLLLAMVWIMQSSTATYLLLEFSSPRCTKRIQAIRPEGYTCISCMRLHEIKVTNDTNISILINFVPERSRKISALAFSPFKLRKTAASQVSVA